MKVQVKMDRLRDFINYGEFDYEMSNRGWVLFDSVVSKELCERMRKDIKWHVERCGELQINAGIPGAPDGTAHHAVGYGDSLDEFLRLNMLEDYIKRFFEGPYILHAFNPIMNFPGKKNYVQNIHNDVRSYTGAFRLQLNMLVMVDEFTIENGATHIVSGSHGEAVAPSKEYFTRYAERIVGAEGSIVLFDSSLWHAAGQNISLSPRAALTVSLSRPFIKPQMDYARFLGMDYGASLSPALRQLLGYNSQVATCLEEWYRPAHLRMYRSDQG